MILRAALLLSLLGSGVTAAAQAAAPVTASPGTLEISLAYSADRTNGVVGGCGCFWMDGGKAEAVANFTREWSAVAELAGEHANNINSAGESLGLVSYLFGPRYSFRNRSRLVPFAQALVGGVHGFDALFPGPAGSAPNPDAFAFAAGGGLNVRLSRRFALRLIQAGYEQTHLPNDGNNRQNHLRISAGVIFRFGQNH